MDIQKKRETDEAHAYLKVVRDTDESKFREFLRILRDFEFKLISTKKLVSLVKTLFQAHPELLLGINEFLPEGYKIDDPEREEEGPEEAEQEAEEEKAMQQALSFVTKVKMRFIKEAHVYNKFLEALNGYRQGKGVAELKLQISSLFVGHGDLVEDFSGFLPRESPLRPNILVNPHRHDEANGPSQVQPRNSGVSSSLYSTGKRSTSPAGGHGGAADVGNGVPEHSPPRVKKKRRQMDEDEEVVPMHLCPMFKKKRMHIEKEEVKDRTDYNGRQGFTMQVQDETHRENHGDCEEHQEEVREQSDIHPLQKCHRRDSPPKVRIQPMKTDIVEDELDTTHGSESEIGIITRFESYTELQVQDQSSSDSEIQQWSKTGRVANETNRADYGDSEEHQEELREQTDMHALQKSHQKNSPCKVRLLPTKTDIVKDELDTTHGSESKIEMDTIHDSESDIEIQVQDQTFLEDPPPPLLEQQGSKTRKVGNETNRADRGDFEEHLKEVRKQMDIHVLQNFHQKDSPAKVRMQPTKTDVVEDDLDTIHGSETEMDTIHDSESEDSATKKEMEVRAWAPRGFETETTHDNESEDSATKKEMELRAWAPLEFEIETTHDSESEDSARAWTPLGLPHSPAKLRQQQERIVKVEEAQGRVNNKVDKEKYTSYHCESEDSAEELGKQPDVCAAQEFPQDHSPSKIRKQRAKTDWMEAQVDTLHQYGRKESVEGGKQTDVCAPHKLTQEQPPLSIRKQQRRIVNVEDDMDTTHHSESNDFGKELGDQMDVCAAQKLPQEHSPTKFRKQERRFDKTDDENDAIHQCGSMEFVKDVGGQASIFSLQMVSKHSPLKVSKEKKVKEENDDANQQSGRRDAGEQIGVHASQKLPAESSPVKVRKQRKKASKSEEEDAVLEHSPPKVKRQEEKADKGEEKNKTCLTGSEESGKEAGKQVVVDASKKVPQKRSSARLAHEFIRKQCQAAEAALAQGPCAFRLLEEEQKKIQQLEDRKSLILQQRQHKFLEKVNETVERSHSSVSLSRCLQAFSEEILRCPELQSLLTEVMEEQELEYSQCKRCTSSYYLLPKSYLKPLTTHRTDLDWEVLNDSWVSAGCDSECQENPDDECSGSRKQIGRESASKRVPHDKRLFHEEKLFLCEDDQFELDLLRQTTTNTIERVARMVELLQAPGFCMQSFDWDDFLTPINFRCIERIYGDYGVEFIEQAQKNPVIALPIILGHLKQKEEDEWPKYQVEMNKTWAEVHAEHFHKSLDYSQDYVKQSDGLCTDSFLIESELNGDSMEDDITADGEQDQLTLGLSFGHPDLEVMYHIIKYLLEEVHMTEEQFKKVQTVWSVHLEFTDDVPGNAEGEGDTEMARKRMVM